MAKNDNLKDFLTDVADAIREKKGTTDLINPQDFSAEIASIQSGGGAVAVSPKAVNFYDYEGTILHSYTKEEFLALTELPPLPTREGLICQEWNWDYADAVEYVSEYGVLEVGATYITDDGKTRLYITIAAEGRMDVPLSVIRADSEDIYVDWGDGSEREIISDAGNVHHYAKIGNYIISIEGKIKLGNSGPVIGGATTTSRRAYTSMLKKVEMGSGVIGIADNGFSYCYNLSEVSVSKECVALQKGSFTYCTSLKYLAVPKNAILGIYAFQNASAMKNISFPNSISNFTQSLFSSCSSLERCVCPANLAELPYYTFKGCSSLAFVNIPKSTTLIAQELFNTCYSLVNIKIPKGVTKINTKAFSGCASMGFYDFSASENVPTLVTTDALSSIPSDCKIIAPDALYDTWIAATNWSTYASYIIKKSEWDALNA